MKLFQNWTNTLRTLFQLEQINIASATLFFAIIVAAEAMHL
jgi:hypothetical protein